MLVFEHNHPHVLLLQLGNAFFKLPGGRLRPGEDGTPAHKTWLGCACCMDNQSRLCTMETGMVVRSCRLPIEVEGLKRKLANNMAPEAASLQPSWDVGDCIATFWRPNFDVALYPYLPAHITRPKEVKKLFLVPMPERCYLAVRGASAPATSRHMRALRAAPDDADNSYNYSHPVCCGQVPRNAKLLAVPLFEIHENTARYGPVIAALPYMVSRFRLTMAGAPSPAALQMPPPGAAEAADGNGAPVQAC